MINYNDVATWPSHLTRHINPFGHFYEVYEFNSPRQTPPPWDLLSMPSYYWPVSTNDYSEVIRMSWSQGLRLSMRTGIFHRPMVVVLLRKHYYYKLLQVVVVRGEFLALLLKATCGATTCGDGEGDGQLDEARPGNRISAALKPSLRLVGWWWCYLV